MSKKVLLIYPGGFGSIFPELPMSHLYLSWALKKKGYEPQIVDMRIDKIEDIDRSDYLFVGISSMTGLMINEGLLAAKYIRSLNPHTPIVWGGIHVTLLPEQSLKNEFVDIIVRGEGEQTIQELAIAIENNSNLSMIKGISYKQGDELFHNPDRDFIDMNSIDIYLPYELFKMDQYSFTAFPVHTSRGCPYRCGFCYNTSFNKRHWRHKTATRVLDEIEYVMKKFSVNNISFTWEDEFFINVNRVKEICEGIVSRQLEIKWNSFCRFNNFKKVDEDLLRLIEKSGCISLSFGGESGSQRVLDEVIKKDIKIEDIISATERLAKTNIEQVVSFMSGLPDVTEEDMVKTFNLIDTLVKINPKIYPNGLFLYTPYPGTPLFEFVTQKYGYRSPQSLEEWANFGIYRSLDGTWHSKDYFRKYKSISILTRFPFWKNNYKFSDVKKAIGGSRFGKFPFNVVYYILARLAIYRWKKRFFRFPLEWVLVEKILEKIRGFV